MNTRIFLANVSSAVLLCCSLFADQSPASLYAKVNPTVVEILVDGVVALAGIDYRHGAYTGCNGYAEVCYVAAATDRGSSGGGWVNGDGELVGVQSGWVDRLGTKDNSGLCIISPPAPTARFVRDKARPSKSWLGAVIEEIWTQPKGFVARFPDHTSGLVIHSISPEGPLDRAGVERERLITAVDGESMVYRNEFMDYLRTKNPGEQIELTLMTPDSHAVEVRQIVLGSAE